MEFLLSSAGIPVARLSVKRWGLITPIAALVIRHAETIIMTNIQSWSRRDLLRLGVGAAAATVLSGRAHARQSNRFRIGFISPASGPLAIFAEPDQYVMQQVLDVTGQGLRIDGHVYPVEILYRDSQSSAIEAARLARELIIDHGVDLMLASATPATTNPVADVCEQLAVPCLTNDTPWQAHFFGRGGDPKVGFKWTWHFFWGLEDMISASTSLWSQLETNQRFGGLWPDDADGRAWASDKGFPPALRERGFEVIDPGRFQPGNEDI